MSASITNGWVKLHRCLLEHPRFKNPSWLAVWVYLLLKATHHAHRVTFDGRIIELQPGQLVTGRRAISEATGVHEAKVKRILKMMRDDQQIDQQAGVKGSIITVRNWHKYQGSGQQMGQQADNKRQRAKKSDNENVQQNGQPLDAATPCSTDSSGVEPCVTGQQNGQRVDSNYGAEAVQAASNKNKRTRRQQPQEGKDNLEVLIPSPLDVPNFHKAWRKWQQHRHEIRKPLTPTTATAQLAKLAGWGVERAIAALELSITNGWQNIFEPRGELHANNHRNRVAVAHGKYANVGTIIA